MTQHYFDTSVPLPPGWEEQAELLWLNQTEYARRVIIEKAWRIIIARLLLAFFGGYQEGIRNG